LRGTAKPSAATSKGWREWKNEAEQAHPIRYWIAEEGLDYVQGFLNWPFDKLNDVRYYINNRWVTRTHSLTAHPRDIKPGNWCDVGNRFLPCLFNELVDFVEVEQAWHHVLWDEEARKKYQVPFWRRGWLRWRTWRSPEAGMSHLMWAASLTNTDYVNPSDPSYGQLTTQASAAKEIIDLYVWWKHIYPNRPDPHEASGWSEVCKKRRQKSDDILWDDSTPEEKEETKKALDMSHQLELQYNQDDEEMMIRLIKIRQGLWT
jgi:hypothetical protein